MHTRKFSSPVDGPPLGRRTRRRGPQERLRRALASVLLVASGLGVVGAVALPAATASASTPQTVTFSYTGSSTTWTAPADTASAQFTVTGASGESSNYGLPGTSGGLVTGSFNGNLSGDVFTIGVGSYLGGGQGGVCSGSCDNGSLGSAGYGGAGGGASWVSSRYACPSGVSDYCFIAGGGGGGGGYPAGGVSGGCTETSDGAPGNNGTGGAGGGGCISSGSVGLSGSALEYGGVGGGSTSYGGAGGTGGQGYGGGGGGGAGFGDSTGGDGGAGGNYADTTDATGTTQGTSTLGPNSNGQISVTYILAVRPTITSSSTSATFAEGSLGTYTFTATGTPAPTFSETGTLPTGVSLSSSGVLSGTPTQAGAFPITVTASNGFSPNATQSFTLYVDAPPSISEPSLSATAVVSQSMPPVDFTATGYPAPTFSETGTLPTGVSLSSAGVLSGTPSEGGSFPVTVTATNTVQGVVETSSTSFTLTVDESPSITSATTSTFSVGTAGTFTVQASGYPTPTLSLSSSSTLPSGVSFIPGASGTATIAGTPASGTGGSYQLGISASSSAGSAAQIFDLVVDSKATFTSPATIDIDAGSTVSFQVTTTGGYPVPSLTATASSLPTGLTFTPGANGTATLAGTMNSANEGTYHPTFNATSSVGTVTQDATLTVQAPGAAVSNCPTGDICGGGGSQPAAPAITSMPSTTFLMGAPGSYQIVATGTPAPTCSASGALPGGVTLSSACVLSGTPTTSGNFTVTVKASNASGSASQSFTLTVTAPAPPSSGGGGGGTTTVDVPVPTPTQTPPSIGTGPGGDTGTATFTQGTGGSFQIPVSGTPEPTCSLASGSLPPGLSLSKGCLVSGSPTGGGTYTFTVKASNANGSTTETLTLTVQPPKVVVVPPSGPDYRFVGVLFGALRYRVSSPASLKGTHVATSGKVLQGLDSDFGFDGRSGLGRVHVILQRDVRTLRVRRFVHGHQRLVERHTASYVGVLVLVEPAHHGSLVFRQFTGVALHGKIVHAVAIGRLSVAKRVRVHVKVHGRERLVWRTRRIERPLRFAFQVSPSTS